MTLDYIPKKMLPKINSFATKHTAIFVYDSYQDADMLFPAVSYWLDSESVKLNREPGTYESNT